MKVLLILPTSGYKHGYPSFFSNSDFPVGFAYIASAIRTAGHEVYGLNPNNDVTYKSAYEMVYDKIVQSLHKNKPDLIGLGGISTDFKFIKDAIQIIRKIAPNIPIVCGGRIISCDTDFIFHTLHPDFCIIGEGEEIMVKLVYMLESGKRNFQEIANLGYWDNDIAKFTERNFTYIDLDKRAFPDYEPFGIQKMLDEYSMATRYVYRYTRQNPRPMTIVSARGCPFSCTFCLDKKNEKYRSRSIKNIMQEIKELYEKYHFNILIILDELFVAKKERLREFCVALLDARERFGWDFDWIFQTHANSSLNYEVLEMAKKAGCYCFTYGVESASPRVLASMNKRTKPSQIAKGIDIANSLGIGFFAAFIYGDIVETEETISESMNFFYRYCLDTHIYIAAISPYPGSKLFEECLKNGIIHNKLKYYEHIDEHVFNMTTIPNRLWFPWIYLTIYLSTFFQFTKSIKAFYCIKDTEATNDPIALYYKKEIYKIGATCPHCKKENHYRELLLDNKTAVKDVKNSNIWILIEVFIRRVLGLKPNKYNMPKTIIKVVLFLSISFKHSLFKTLKPLLEDKEFLPSFTTGCQHCDKRIRVNIPNGSIEKGFRKTRKLLRMVLRI